MISETQFEHQLRIARASALTMHVLYLRRLAERLRWLVQQTEESGNVERAKRFAKELAKAEAKLTEGRAGACKCMIAPKKFGPNQNLKKFSATWTDLARLRQIRRRKEFALKFADHTRCTLPSPIGTPCSACATAARKGRAQIRRQRLGRAERSSVHRLRKGAVTWRGNCQDPQSTFCAGGRMDHSATGQLRCFERA